MDENKKVVSVLVLATSPSGIKQESNIQQETRSKKCQQITDEKQLGVH